MLRLFGVINDQALRTQPGNGLGYCDEGLPFAGGRVAGASHGEQLIAQARNAAPSLVVRAEEIKHDHGEVLRANGGQILRSRENCE